MYSILAQLLEILKEEGKKYKLLLGLSKKKRDKIIAKDLEELNSITLQEERIIEEVSKAEQQRESLIKKLANSINYPVSELTLKKIIELFPTDLTDSLQKVRKEFLAVLHDLKAVNDLNTGLIADSLSYVTYTLDAISQMTRPKEITYDGMRRRRKRKEGRTSILVDREA
jgi:ABC-type cobalamin/Fe3+-siderophores transport system ATPase subunit